MVLPGAAAVTAPAMVEEHPAVPPGFTQSVAARPDGCDRGVASAIATPVKINLSVCFFLNLNLSVLFNVNYLSGDCTRCHVLRCGYV